MPNKATILRWLIDDEDLATIMVWRAREMQADDRMAEESIGAQPMLRAYLLAEHTGCPLVPDMLTNSRTTFTHRAIRWLTWEMPWHTAHHAAPTVPFHRLATLSAEIEGALKSTAQGHIDAHHQIPHAIDAHRWTQPRSTPKTAANRQTRDGVKCAFWSPMTTASPRRG